MAEVEERDIGALRLARFQDCLDRAFAHVLDGRQPEADPLLRDREVLVALVHVRGEHLDPEVTALVDVAHYFVGVPHFAGEQGRHELVRVVRLQVGRLVGDERVGRGVRLVEPVAGELLDQLEELLRLLLRDLPLLRALDELGAELDHLLRLLLAHRAPHEVRLAEREARDLVRDRHDLFLVDDHPVGLLQDLLQDRHLVRDRDLSLLALDEVGDQVHGAGPVQGDDGDDVLEAVGTESGEQIAHARALQLEEAHGLAGGEQRERLRIVQRQSSN